MKEFGLDWEVKEISLASIDNDASRQNHARFGGTDEGVVEEYALAMTRGDIFPRIVVKPKDGKFIVFGGNHTRLAAEAVGDKTIQAYILKACRKEDDDLLPRALNRGHGLRQDRSEALANAVYAVTAPPLV